MRSPRTVLTLLVVVATGGLLVWVALSADMEDPGPPKPMEARDGVEQIMHIHGLEVPPWADGGVYVGTHHGLVRIDAEGEWRHVSEEQHDFMGFAANPAEQDVLYSSGHPAPGTDLADPIGFMVSEDGGESWDPRALEGQADFHAMAVGGSGEVIYGWDAVGDPGLHRSDDQGRTWERLDVGMLDAAGDVVALAVHPADADEVLAATETGLLRSDDAGSSWEAVLEEPTTTVAHTPGRPERLLAYVPAPGRGLMASEDAGATWTALGLDLEDDAAGHIAVHPGDPQIIYVGTFGETLLRTTDGGESWEELASAGVPAGAR